MLRLKSTLALAVLAGIGLPLAAQFTSCPGNQTAIATPNCVANISFADPTAVSFSLADTLNYTGAVITWPVPAGVDTVTITAYGAQGNHNVLGVVGGLGGMAAGDLAVSFGDTLHIYVGGGGSVATLGGFNGGGNAGNSPCATALGGGGGGATDIRLGGMTLADRVLVAGGGGGAAGNRISGCGRGTGGGGGGGYYGGGGGAAWPSASTIVPTGGTQSAGGIGGTSTYTTAAPANNGQPGALGTGGNGGDELQSNQGGANTGAVGATGGGSTGNNGTYAGNFTGQSGAGGSGYTGGVSNGTMANGIRSGNGLVIINFTSSISQVAGLPNNSPFPVGTTTQTYITSSPSGLDTCSFTVTVQDTVLPTVANCPANITVNPVGLTCETIVQWNMPTFSDNCGYSLSFNHQPGDAFPVGTTAVTYTATDSSGNTASCTFDITVAPVIDSIVSAEIVCDGDPFDLEALPGYNSYLWSNGDTTMATTGTNAGIYWVEVSDTSGCSARDSFTYAYPALPAPVVVPNGPQVCASQSFAGYVWLLNGNPIAGATGQCYQPTTNGSYSVMVVDSLGCEATSAPLSFVGVQNAMDASLRIFPNPTQDRVQVRVDMPVAGTATLRIYDLSGRLMHTQDASNASQGVTLSLKHLPAGTYLLELSAEGYLGRRNLVRID